MRTLRLTAAAIGLVGNLALGDLLYISQERTVSVGDFCGNVAVIAAPGFAPFHASMHEGFKPWTVAQDSWLHGESIHFRGESSMDYFYLPHCFQFGESWLRVGFELTEAVGFRLSGEINAAYEGSGDSVDLSGPGTAIHFGAPSLVRAAGVLEPGSYTLSIRLWSVDVAAPDYAAAEVWFSVPSPSAVWVMAVAACPGRRRTSPV